MRPPILFVLALVLLFSTLSDLVLSGNIALNPATKDRVFMTVNGEPFFPVGSYIGPHAVQLETFLDSGLNLGLIEGFDLLDPSRREWNIQVLNELASHGIKVIAYPFHTHRKRADLHGYDCEGESLYINFELMLEDFNRILALVNSSEHPENVIGWYLIDEPDLVCVDCDTTVPGGHEWCGVTDPNGKFDYCYEPSFVDSIYHFFKDIEPAGRYLCHCVAAECLAPDSVPEFVRFASSTDFILNDEYDFRNCCGHDYYWRLPYHAEWTGNYPAGRDKPFIAVMSGAGPCFTDPWVDEVCGPKRCPESTKCPPRTVDSLDYIDYWPLYFELRYTVYSSILHGARGILFWNWGRSRCSNPDTSSLPFYSAIAREILVGDPSQNVPPIKDLVLRQGWYWTTWVTSSHDGIDMCWCDADSCPRRPPGASPSNGMDDVNYLAVMQWYPGETIRYFLIVVNDCGSPKEDVLFHFDEPFWSFDSSKEPQETSSAPPYQSPWFNAYVRLIPPFYHPWEQSGKEVGFNNDNVWMDLDPWEVCVLEIYRCLEGRPCHAGVATEKPKGEQAILRVEQNFGPGGVSLVFGVPDGKGELLKLELYDVLGRHLADAWQGVNDGSLRRVTVGFDQGNDVRIKSPGIYFARLHVNGKPTLTRKVVLVR